MVIPIYTVLPYCVISHFVLYREVFSEVEEVSDLFNTCSEPQDLIDKTVTTGESCMADEYCSSDDHLLCVLTWMMTNGKSVFWLIWMINLRWKRILKRMMMTITEDQPTVPNVKSFKEAIRSFEEVLS